MGNCTMNFGDSLVITSPGRTGSHWLLFMLEELLNIPRYEQKTFQREDHLGDFINHLNHSTPAIYNVHQRYSVARTIGKPLIVSIRDPRDVLISAAHYNGAKLGGRVSDLIHYYAKGPLHLGWFDDYVSARNKEDHFCVCYEDLHLRGTQVLCDILSWLGVKHDPNHVSRVYGKWTVEKTRSVTNPILVRKGLTKEWETILSENEKRYIMDKMGDHLKALGYE